MAGEYLNDRVLDNGLNAIVSEANRLDICLSAPTTYAQATSTYSLGNKLSPKIGSPGLGSPNGRSITIAPISDGTITNTGTAAYYALVDTSSSRLLAAGPLGSSAGVTAGNVFTLGAITIRIPAVTVT